MNLRLKLTALLAVAALAACGNDNNDNNGGVKVYPKGDTDVTADAGHDAADPEDTGPDATAPDDTGEPTDDVGPDADEPDVTEPVQCEDGCGPGEDCVNDTCRIVDSCAAAIDLGTLAPGVPQTVTGSLFFEGVDDRQATCNPGSGKNRVVSFEIAETSVVRHQALWDSQYDGVVEVRTACDDDSAVVQCNDQEDRMMLLEPGRYYVLLNQVFGNAEDYTLTLTAETALCVPGVTTCDGDTLQTCPNPLMPQENECGTGCTAGVCTGSVCSDAIVVTGSGTFSGSGQAHLATSNNLNFGTNAGCTEDDDGTLIPTPGYEVVFFLPGLTAGQTIGVDAETGDTNINAIFITQSCGDTAACSAAFRYSEDIEWVVDADGDYYVIVDKRTTSIAPFNYSITVQ